MAKLIVGKSNVRIDLSSRERYLLARPNLIIELERISGVSVEPGMEKERLGVRVSKRPLTGGVFGDWRSGSKRLLVLGRAKAPALRLRLNHPGIDEIWYFSPEADKLAHSIRTITKLTE